MGVARLAWIKECKYEFCMDGQKQKKEEGKIIYDWPKWKTLKIF
jgi:hypothetical protein